MRIQRAGPERTRRTLRRAATLMGALTALWAASLLFAGMAVAEPYLAVREGYKCSKCHLNRTGGNARTDYAKVYTETRLAASGAEVGAEASAVEDVEDYGHGRLSPYFNVSADLRQFVEYRRFRGETNEETTWQYGRRSTCVGCHLQSQGGGKLAEAYLQLEPMPGTASIVIAENFLPAPTTRELYGLLEFDALNAYVKAGMFRMPTALRNTWDDPYIHGNLEPESAVTNLVGLVSVRSSGMEVGIEPGPFSVSVSVTNPETSIEASEQPRGKRTHLNAYAVGSLGMLGFSWYQDPYDVGMERRFFGLWGGASLGRLTGLLEVDAYRERDIELYEDTNKGSLFAEADVLISRGHNVKWQYEAFDPDRAIDDDRSQRHSLIYEPFFTPYLQVRGGARRWAGPRQIQGYNGTSVFVELHLIY